MIYQVKNSFFGCLYILLILVCKSTGSQSENAYIRITFIQLAVASIIPDTLRTPAFNINILKMKTEQEISVVNPDLVGSRTVCFGFGPGKNERANKLKFYF